MEDNTPSKWYPEKGGHSHIYIRQNRFHDKKKVARNKDRHFIMIKGTINQDDITHHYICNQLGSTKIYKAMTNRPKGKN